MPIGYAIILHSEATEELLRIFDGYVREKNTLKYILSNSIDIGNQFTTLELVKDKNDIAWKVSIPNHSIIAIAELGSVKSKFGFAP